MQITSAAAAANRVSYLNAAVSDTRAPDQDFLSVVNAAYDAAVSPDIPKAEANAATRKIASPERDQTIADSSVTEKSSSLPVGWNEESLAQSVALSFTGDINFPIDTTKTINWESSGDHKLTSEEIAQLKEKYDVTHLSAQEYYDLMSDLTHMNVLSGNDVMGVFCRHVGDGFMMGHVESLAGRTPTIQQGNLLKYLAAALSQVLEYWGWLSSDDFKKANSHLSIDAQRSWNEGALKDIEPRQNMLNVMRQLQ
ncbi:MAG: hypothetical protein HDT26_12045 [Subdoligranulum sp.]|nr:hypothetical protein [Subdoligranulum sp.]